MAFIEWSDEYSVQHEKLDFQHQQLFTYINDFYEALEKNASKEELSRIFSKVVDFTDYHFRDEEELLEKAKYPKLDTHKAIHRQLIQQVKELQELLRNDEPGIANRIKLFLKNWLTAHIKGIDLPYAPYVKFCE